ncbi:MAG: HU family DNA-binding protein [Muribaculaceae bacterium]|nr:HU family DNA-binding protein [Muribaculaceae bacterium]
MDNKTLIDKIAGKTGLERGEAQRMVTAICEIIADSCVAMDAVVIPGFGQFEARKRKERLTIHPSTGERLLVPPKLILSFRPSGVLKSKIESLDKD